MKTICLMCHGETLFKGMDLDAWRRGGGFNINACGKLRIGEALSPVAWEGLFAPKTGIYTTKTFVWFDKYL